ncbi:MAG: hypothetical protein AB1499_16725 [Nitrospirota bacterium]
MKQNSLLFISLLILVSLIGCAPGLVDIPLEWKPTSNLFDFDTTTLTNLYTKKIKIALFIDKRENKYEIGKNIERKKDKLVTTKDDVALWCTERLKSTLSQLGFSIVDSNEDIILGGEILDFYVTEAATYKANIGFKVVAETPSGIVLWQGITSGKSTRFGHSYSLENYYEALSNAYVEAVHGLLKSKEFAEAIK